jgi:hypothetical protein
VLLGHENDWRLNFDWFKKFEFLLKKSYIKITFNFSHNEKSLKVNFDWIKSFQKKQMSFQTLLLLLFIGCTFCSIPSRCLHTAEALVLESEPESVLPCPKKST